jgi:hypothetical protein
MTVSEATAALDQMMARDPATKDVVQSMRAQGRTDIRIVYCFKRHMVDELKMEFPE